MATTEDKGDGESSSIDQLADELNLSSQPAAALKDEFDDTDEIVEHLRGGGTFTTVSGVGNRTSTPLWDWFKSEHPDANRERKIKDEAYCTEFTHDHGLSEEEMSDPEKQYWAFVCPRCGDKNVLTGDPQEFRNAPFACLNCHWVSCLDSQSIEEWLAESEEGEA